jgi:hypothetical protein
LQPSGNNDEECAMEGGIPNPEVFTHVRVIIGIILGLSVSRLLTGIARIIQHPQHKNIYAVHLGWVLFAFLTVVHFLVVRILPAPASLVEIRGLSLRHFLRQPAFSRLQPAVSRQYGRLFGL